MSLPEDFPRLSEDVRRPRPSETGRAGRRTFQGWLLRAAVGTPLLAILAWLLTQLVVWPSREKPPSSNALPAASHLPLPNGQTGNRAALEATSARSDSTAPAVQRVLQQSIVLIESEGPTGNQILGSGFVVDASGLVATSLHVIREATDAVARFHDGSLFQIDGYAAVSPERDLAIVKLKGIGREWTPAVLHVADPPQLAPVVAIGHPQGIAFSPFDGKVSLVLTTSQLSAGSREFLHQLTGHDTELRWIQHTANLSDGNSGGPLLDTSGRVIGLNTWVDRQSGFAYALHAGEVADLVKQSTAVIEPLEAHASSEARLRTATWKSSADALRQLREQAQAMRWRPWNAGDYAVLQQIAWSVTLANNPDLFSARAALGSRLDPLVQEADRVTAQLRKEKWNDIGQITLLNEHAALQVFSPARGLMAFVTIDRIVEGRRGQRAALARLAGFDQSLLVPIEGTLNAPEPGGQYLLLGVNDRGRTVHYGDNPLQPLVAPVIVAPVLIELSE